MGLLYLLLEKERHTGEYEIIRSTGVDKLQALLRKWIF
jgi:hypothetical protein